ncbi:MAG: SDR family NAD(P)-dependent oxidoreductase [Solirubrobacteraceae bacterium]
MSRGSGSGGRRVLVLGGSSEIALAIVRELQSQSPREVALVGRDAAALGAAAAALGADGCQRVLTFELDALDLSRHEQVLKQAFQELGGADIVILAVGVLGERGGLPADIPAAVAVLQVNLVGAGSLLMYAARELCGARGGTLVVLSSVAAERPRRANVVYGASKAGLDSLAQGLGDALHEHDVRVLVVRPGFVRTKMTQGLDAAPLASTPQAVAAVTVDALDRGAHTVWAPRSLRWLMFIMKLVPRRLFRTIKQ